MNTLKFSPIKKADLPVLMPIENACHSHPWSEKTFTSCIGGRYFGELAAPTDKQDDIIGFYVGEYVLGEATLMDICVVPSEQGKGLGNVFLKHFVQTAKTLGAQKIWLEVRASNISALMMYINHGFIETGRRTGYYPKEIGYEDAIVMCKTC